MRDTTISPIPTPETFVFNLIITISLFLILYLFDIICWLIWKKRPVQSFIYNIFSPVEEKED
jgi:hypothetical protein